MTHRLAVTPLTALLLGTVWALTTLLLGIDIRPPAESPLGFGEERSLRERVTSLVTAGTTWKAVVYLATKVVFGLVSFVTVMTLLVTSMSLLLVPFVYDQPNVYVGLALEEPATLHPALSYGWEGLLVGVRAAVDITSWQVTTLPEALFVAAGDYHHHVGLNTWNHRSAPADGRGLDWFELTTTPTGLDAAVDRLEAAGYAIEETENGATVRDPDGIEVRLRFED